MALRIDSDQLVAIGADAGLLADGAAAVGGVLGLAFWITAAGAGFGALSGFFAVTGAATLAGFFAGAALFAALATGLVAFFGAAFVALAAGLDLPGLLLALVMWCPRVARFAERATTVHPKRVVG